MNIDDGGDYDYSDFEPGIYKLLDAIGMSLDDVHVDLHAEASGVEVVYLAPCP